MKGSGHTGSEPTFLLSGVEARRKQLKRGVLKHLSRLTLEMPKGKKRRKKKESIPNSISGEVRYFIDEATMQFFKELYDGPFIAKRYVKNHDFSNFYIDEIFEESFEQILIPSLKGFHLSSKILLKGWSLILLCQTSLPKKDEQPGARSPRSNRSRSHPYHPR